MSRRSLAGEVYDGSAELGKFQAGIGLIVSIIIAFVLLIFGIYCIINDDSRDHESINGTITRSKCTEHTTYDSNNRPIVTYSCDIAVKYTYLEKEYNKDIFTQQSVKYMVDQSIKLKILKKDPTKAEIDSIGGYLIGSILLGISLIVFAGSYLNYYMTNKYKSYAVAQGVGTMSSVVFRR